MPLQHYDVVVKSVLETRKIFDRMTDQQFAAWYEQKFMITERRVLYILNKAKEMSA